MIAIDETLHIVSCYNVQGYIALSTSLEDLPDSISRKPMASERIGTHRLALFASPAFCMSALGMPVLIFLPPLYAELGLSLTVIGTVFLAVRVFDVVTDPLFGWLGDKIRTRWGRRRPALLGALPMLIAGVYLTFFPGESPTVLLLTLSMLLLYAGWTAFTISHTAWAGEMSDDYNERSRIMGALQILASLGVLTVSVVPAILDASSTDVSMSQRTDVVGLIILVSLPIFTLLAASSAREPIRAESTTKLHWREAAGSIVANKSLQRLLLADLLLGIQTGTNGTMHFFFIGIVLGLPQAATTMLVVLAVTGLIAAPIMVRLSYRFGKHETLCLGAMIGALGCFAHFFVPVGSFWIVLTTFIMIGVNVGTRELLVRSIMADVIDEDALRTGKERSALFFSTLTLVEKLGMALAVGLVLPILDLVGFDPSGVNSETTITGVRLVAAATPVMALVGVILVMWKFPLDQARQRCLQKQLDARRAGSAA